MDFDPFKTVGDRTLCAWAVSEGRTSIQTSEPAIAKRLRKITDCRQIAMSVRGAWIRIFTMPYTLDWVAKNVVEKLHPDFPRKTAGAPGEIVAGATLMGHP